MAATLRRRFQFTLGAFLLGVAVVAAMFGVVRSYFGEVEGTNQSYERASRVNLIRRLLPPRASGFNYWASPGRGLLMANFMIDEEGFLAWAKDHGWQLEEINATSGSRCVPHIYQRVPGKPRPARSAVLDAGYVYREEHEQQQGRLLVVAYDRNSQRGYLSQLYQ